MASCTKLCKILDVLDGPVVFYEKVNYLTFISASSNKDVG